MRAIFFRVLGFLCKLWQGLVTLAEFTFVLTIFSQLQGRDAAVIVGVLGIIYATSRIMLIRLSLQHLEAVFGLSQLQNELREKLEMEKKFIFSNEESGINTIRGKAYLSIVYLYIIALICAVQMFRYF